MADKIVYFKAYCPECGYSETIAYTEGDGFEKKMVEENLNKTHKNHSPDCKHKLKIK